MMGSEDTWNSCRDDTYESDFSDDFIVISYIFYPHFYVTYCI